MSEGIDNLNKNNYVNQSDENETTYDLLNKLGNEIGQIHDERTPIVSNNSNVPLIFEILPNLIHEMFHKGINFSIENTGEISVKDFYRPSIIKMVMNNDESFSIEIRKEIITINTLDDLVTFNYREWKKTGKGKGNYANPAKCWADLFNEKGLVKRQVTFIPTDD